MKFKWDSIELSPKFLIDDNWKNPKPISVENIVGYPPMGLKPLPYSIEKEYEKKVKQTKKRLKWIESTRIEVANKAETTQLTFDGENEYLKTELGMNIIVPKGRIKQLRFKITLVGNINSHDIVVIDGFPKDIVEEKEMIGGKVKLGISKFFKFVPIVGDKISDLLEIELNPWEFKLGKVRRVNIDFSGALTNEPEWYFKEDGIKNDLRVVITIKKPKRIAKIDGKVVAAWVYDTGFSLKNIFNPYAVLEKVIVQSDEKLVKIY